MGKTLNLPYKIYACGRVGVCAHIHTRLSHAYINKMEGGHINNVESL